MQTRRSTGHLLDPPNMITDTESRAPKLVLVGPVGVGKTSAIRAIADGTPLSTEVPMHDSPDAEKTTTTVALDFATLTLEDSTSVLVYGLPGQENFSFMRPIVLNGAMGVVLMLDARAEDMAACCSAWLEEVARSAADASVVVGVTHADLVTSFSLVGVRSCARLEGRPLPVFTVDAREREQMVQLVRALLVAAG